MDGGYSGSIYEFGSFRVDTIRRTVTENSAPIQLSSKAFETLVLLIRNHGETVSRESIIDTVWSDSFVEDNNLTQQISLLRRVLGEHPGDHKFIVTVPGRGYSFVAPVQIVGEVAPKTRQKRPSSFRTDRFDKARRLGYGLALLLIFSVCLPVVTVFVRGVFFQHPHSLAVLQFRSAPSDEFIGTGISDTLRARLGSVEDVIVRPEFIPGDRDIFSAGRELAVDALVTGSVQRAEERLRITVEMIDVENGRVVWGRTFDDHSANIFELQDSIASEVAQVLKARVRARTDSLSLILTRGI